MNVITLLFEKILKQAMIDRKIDGKEALEMKRFYNPYLDKRTEIMKETQFKAEDVFAIV